MAPYYDQAKRMLGVRINPTMTPSDVHLKAAAEQVGVGDTFHLAPVGVFFGDGDDAEGNVQGGARRRGRPTRTSAARGPSRRACTECGECMTGCRHGAKNTLNENYLHLAEKAGAVVHPMTTVVGLDRGPRQGGYRVATVPTDQRRKSAPRVLRAAQVVVAAGTYGTQTLLHTVRDGGGLPQHVEPRWAS